MLSPTELSSLHDHFHPPDDVGRDRKSVTTEFSSPVSPCEVSPSDVVPRPLSIRRPGPVPPPRHPGRASLPPHRPDEPGLGEHRVREAALGTRRPGWSFGWTIFSLCVVNLVCAIDSSILAVALPTISQDLGGSTTQAFWAGTSFLLTSAVFQPLWALLSHVLGRMETILAALAFFALGTCLALLAKGFPLLLAARGIQGAGAGGLVALTYVIVTDMVSLRERGKWFGIIAMQWAVGGATGPVIGGVLARPDWHWIFWINVPFCIFAFLVTPLSLRPLERGGKRLWRLWALDWPGALLFIAALTSLLVPLTWGGVMYAWSSSATIVPLVLGAAGLVIFCYRNTRCAREPFIRSSLFDSATARAAYFGAVSHGILVYSLLFYMPLYFESAKAFSPVLSGAAILPYTLTTSVSVIATGLLITKTGRYRLYLWLGWALTSLGTGLLLVLTDDTPFAVSAAIGVVGGSGLGIVWSAGSFAAQASAARPDLPFAAAMFTFLRAVGQALGVALGGTIFQNIFRRKIEQDPRYAPYAESFARDASAIVSHLDGLAAPDQRALRELLTSAYVEGFQAIWLVLCVLSTLAAAVNMIWVRDISLDHTLTSEHYTSHGRERAIQAWAYTGPNRWF